MKLNPRIFKQLNQEPFLVQKVNGKQVEFHYMDESPFLFQYASKGRFAVWTSDGKDYKVLIQSTYYQALEDFYTPEVNTIWLNFLERISQLSKKMNLIFMIPMVLLYTVIGLLTMIYFEDNLWTVLLGLLVLVFVSNMVQSTLVSKKARAENQKAQMEIKMLIGEQRFNELVDAQEEHYKNYFKFDEDQTEDVVEEVIDQIEENNEKLNEDEQNGK